jgi:multidrug resistance efflux pump
METKDKLPPIPTPAAQRWREFRIQVLPVVVFGAALFCIVYLWKNFVQPVGIVGLARTNTVNVTCTVDGLITQLVVDQFQTVTQGQVVAVVQNADASLVRVQGEAAIAELEVMRERIKVSVERSEQGYQRYRSDLLDAKIDLAADRAKFFAISNEAVRAFALAKEGLGTQSEADLKKAELDTLVASIHERAVMVAELDKTVAELQRNISKTNDFQSVDGAIDARKREMEEMMKPSTLKAPINGQITFVYHFPGEKIIRGTAIASIASSVSTNIIGFIRQPITVKPNLNEPVNVITRTQPRKVIKGKITQIGAQLESINPSLISVDANRFEWGLPILVDIEPGFPLIPGEYVTLSLAATPR